MSNKIKIFIIAGFVVVISGLLIGFGDALINSPKEKIVPIEFKGYVQKTTNEKIAGNNYEDAKSASQTLIGEITTESFVTINDGRKLITDECKNECLSIVLREYSPVFINYAYNEFSKSSWNDAVLYTIDQEANQLCSYSQLSEQCKDSLKQIVKIKNDYNGAKSLIKNAKCCKKVVMIENYVKQSQNYMYSPLSGNEQLRDLELIENLAKESVINQLKSGGKSLSSNYSSMDSYDNWKSKCNETIEEIELFQDKYDPEHEIEDLDDVIILLDSKEEEVRDYFDKKQIRIRIF